MSASDHLSPAQFVGPHDATFSGREVAREVFGAGTSRGYYSRKSYRLVEKYPLDRIDAQAKSGKEFGGKYVDLETEVTGGRAKPLVIRALDQEGNAASFDGFHRASIAKAAGMTHLPAYVPVEEA